MTVRARYSFEVEGMEEVKNMFSNLAPRVARNLMRSTIQQVAKNIADDAKVIAPVDKGNLKKAIKAKRRKSSPDKPVSVVTVGQGKEEKNDGYYWRFIEHGTVNIKAAPFISVAQHRAQANMPKMLQEEFLKKLEAYIAKELRKSARR